MVLVDSSVWIDHLRKGDRIFAERLKDGEMLTHPFVIEEIACGHLIQRSQVLALLATIPVVPVASHAEILHFISQENLQASGLGAIDVHLLASARLADAKIWTRDKALSRAAKRLGISEPGGA